MKIVNPIGRKPNNELTAHFATRACMCRLEPPVNQPYTDAKGGDGCFHCGCACSSGASTSTTNRARLTIRRSN